MIEIKLNIIGYKTKSDDELDYIYRELKTASTILIWDNPTILIWNNPIKKALDKLMFDIQMEIRRRKTSKKVMVKFTAEWSGYTSKQKKDCAVEYRKINRKIWDKMPKTFIHNFTDGTFNLWRTKVVNKKDEKPYNSYGKQVDKFLQELNNN